MIELLTAGDYSIADMATFAWVRGYEWSGSSIDNLPALQDWLRRIEQRPAVKAGLAIPSESLGGDLRANAAATIEIAQAMLV